MAQTFPPDPPVETARVPVNRHYRLDHILGSIMAGLAGALGVLSALGEFPKDQKGWIGLSLPLLAAAVKSIQSYTGSHSTGPPKED